VRESQKRPLDKAFHRPADISSVDRRRDASYNLTQLSAPATSRWSMPDTGQVASPCLSRV